MNNDIRNLSKWLNEEQETPIDRQALARVLAMAEQPAPATELREQEPIAWPCVIVEADFEQNTITLEMQCSDYKVGAGQHWLSIFQPQRTWVGLTDEEIVTLFNKILDGKPLDVNSMTNFARSIEAAHGIKGDA